MPESRLYWRVREHQRRHRERGPHALCDWSPAFKHFMSCGCSCEVCMEPCPVCKHLAHGVQEECPAMVMANDGDVTYCPCHDLDIAWARVRRELVTT